MYDVIVVGGGPAGLQAALTLGRMHRSTLLLDSGDYRNAPAAHMHNFVTHDGTAPADFRKVAIEQLAPYTTVEVRSATATVISESDDGFAVTTADGQELEAARVLLATGVRDELPDLPGLAALWGSVVAHCPFCHGHEFAGGTVAVQGGPHATRLASMMSRIASDVVVLDGHHEVGAEDRSRLEAAGVAVRDARVREVAAADHGATLTLDDGSTLAVDGFFVRTSFVQSAPFAEQLGLDLLSSGCIEVDAFGKTSRPGVYAAGDLSHTSALPMPLASVLTAASAGLVAAASCHQDLLARELDLQA